MPAKLIIAPEAEADIDEAYGWYEAQRIGLGEEFLGCVDASIAGICRKPELHPIVFKQYRRVLTRRFPYAVFYEHENGLVTVYCVFHTSLDPEKWRKRLT